MKGAMRQLPVILFAAFALITAADANAHLMVVKQCHRNVTCVNHRQHQNLKHARYVCHYGAHQNQRWNCAAVKWLTREYNETEAVLHPRVTVPDLNYWINRQITVATIIGHASSRDPWPNCPDPIFGGGSWYDTVRCENGGNWYDSAGYYRCGLQFDPSWENKYGRLCP